MSDEKITCQGGYELREDQIHTARLADGTIIRRCNCFISCPEAEACLGRIKPDQKPDPSKIRKKSVAGTPEPEATQTELL